MKLLIVDDEMLIREGLKILLSQYEDIEIVGSCANGLEAYQFCENNEVHVILMDIQMPLCNGVEGTRRIKEGFPHISVLMLTTFKDDHYILDALKYGASGYLLKDSSPENIYQALQASLKGNVVMNPEIARVMLHSSHSAPSPSPSLKELDLSEKEIQLIQLVAKGLNNKEIAQQLFLAEGTVKNNISLILSKLFLRDRTQLAIFAFKNDLI